MRLVATLKDDMDRDQHHWDIEVADLTAGKAVLIIEKALYALVENLHHEAQWPDLLGEQSSGKVCDRLRYLSARHSV